METAFGRILSDLGRMIGLEALRPSEDETCVLSIDGETIELSGLDKTDEVRMLAPLGTLASPSPKALSLLLAANVDHGLTDGGSIGMTQDGTVTLSRTIPLQGLDGHRFAGLLERFVDAAEIWRSNVADLGRAGASESADDTAGADDTWIRL